ncbi:MAG: hypothetical protein R2730_01700 [Chitinophagales bacterium]
MRNYLIFVFLLASFQGASQDDKITTKDMVRFDDFVAIFDPSDNAQIYWENIEKLNANENPFEGDVYEINDEGEMKIMTFHDGKITMIRTYFKDSNILKSESTFNNGLRREYFKNGKIKKEQEIVDGQVISVKYFDEDGNILKP